MVSPLPPGLLALLSPEDTRVVSIWWSALREEARGELLLAWDPRAHSCRYNLEKEDDEADEKGQEGAPREGRWRRLAIQVVAEITDPEDPEDPGWPLDLYEYLIGHEIILNDWRRPMHICTRHEAGRQAARSGDPGAICVPGRRGFLPLAGPERAGRRSALALRARGRRRRGGGGGGRGGDDGRAGGGGKAVLAVMV